VFFESETLESWKVFLKNSEDKRPLRLWLRWLHCSTMIENEVRRRLRERFQITLPQFDLLSALERVDRPMTMSELSEYLLVSNGNVTGVVRRLTEKGWLNLKHQPEDRRKQTVCLSERGRHTFLEMAHEHRDWISTLMSGIRGQEDDFGEYLKKIRSSIEKQ
jgi:DNA-binding MarR family transcriptional regulator